MWCVRSVCRTLLLTHWIRSQSVALHRYTLIYTDIFRSWRKKTYDTYSSSYIKMSSANKQQVVVEGVEALKSLSPPNSPKASPKKSIVKSPTTKFPSLRKSLQKRSSKITLFAKEKSTKEFAQPANITDEMIRLETVILSQKGRQLLIQDLLGLPGNHSVKVRFIASVDTYDDAESKDERQRLGQKIAETFIVKGGMFTIPLSDERVESITSGNYDNLLHARRDILEELANDVEVMDSVGEVEAMDGV